MPKSSTRRSSSEREPSAAARLAEYVGRFSPQISALANNALAWMRKRLPGSVELVYDNAYALVIGFSPNERPSSALFSIAIYPKKVSLCFLYGARLPDPGGVLAGSGNQVRHIRLEDAATLDEPKVRAMIDAAVAWAGNPFTERNRRRTIVRAVSANRRPRR